MPNGIFFYPNLELGFNVFSNWFIGSIANSTKQIRSSPPTAGPFTIREYIAGDIPAGAYSPKKTTPEIKWHINLIKNAMVVPSIGLSLKYPASPIAKDGKG